MNETEKQFFRTAAQWLTARFMQHGGHIDRYTKRVTKLEWLVLEIDCYNELALIVMEMKNALVPRGRNQDSPRSESKAL